MLDKEPLPGTFTSNFRPPSLSLTLCPISRLSCTPPQLLGDVLGFPEEYLAPLAVMGFFSIFIANGKELSYYMLKIFFKSIFNIFFSR
jgi:hypothetical protein